MFNLSLFEYLKKGVNAIDLEIVCWRRGHVCGFNGGDNNIPEFLFVF